jgi:tetratricopeptide (TPR) repeat protein
MLYTPPVSPLSTMGSRVLRRFCIILLASVFPATAGHDSLKQEMRFGAEAAQRGLWREAAFRWEKILKDDPNNAHVHNNLAVASESLGQFEKARLEYEEARRLAPDNKEIKNNYQSFLELCRTLKACGGETQPAAEATPAAPAGTPEPADGGPAAVPSPADAPPAPSPTPGGA